MKAAVYGTRRAGGQVGGRAAFSPTVVFVGNEEGEEENKKNRYLFPGMMIHEVNSIEVLSAVRWKPHQVCRIFAVRPSPDGKQDY
jgi:hypothetical protein